MAQHGMNYGRGYQQPGMMQPGMNMAAMQQHQAKGHAGGGGAGMPGGGHGMPGGGGHPMPSGGTSIMSPAKEVNLASLVLLGQETVQDIVSKTVELFKQFTTMQLPNNVTTMGTYSERNVMPINMQNYQERKAKLNEVIPNLQMNFRKVRIIFDKINEHTAPLDADPVEKLLPIEENGEIKGERAKPTESMKFAVEEYKDTCEQLRLKSLQMKEIIDQLRTVTWEINTMMAMRKV